MFVSSTIKLNVIRFLKLENLRLTEAGELDEDFNWTWT